MHRILLSVLAVVVPVSASAVGTLQVGEPTVEGSQVIVPVYLGGDIGSGVSALDFRLRYDASVFRPVTATAGSAAQYAGKQVMGNEPSPGEYVVVMMGMNQATCSSGEVAQIVLEKVNADAAGWQLDIAQPTLSSADGDVIPSDVLPGWRNPDAQTDDADHETPATNEQPPRPSTSANATRMEPSSFSGGGSGALPDPMALAGTSPGRPGALPGGRLAGAVKSADAARRGIPTPVAVMTPSAGNAADSGDPATSRGGPTVPKPDGQEESKANVSREAGGETRAAASTVENVTPSDTDAAGGGTATASRALGKTPFPVAIATAGALGALAVGGYLLRGKLFS